ncbi:MAG: GldG family protein [Chloroflexi bacterium]|nr:GldG family protein [Chloroflexota bacterium]
MSLLDRIREPSAVLGMLALLVAGGAALVAGEFGALSRVALGASALLFGLYVAIDPDKALQTVTGRQWVYGSNTLVLSAALIGILVLVNVVSVRFHQRWDLTAQGDFSLSESTLRILGDLPAQVHAKAFFSGGLSDRQKTEDLLKEYEQRSNGKVSWEMIDTFQQPSLADLEKISVDGTVVFSMGDRRQTTITSDEAHMTTALLKLVNPTQLKVYYSVGHGEREIERFDDRGYSNLRTQIQQENYLVENLNLLATGEVPSDAAALIIAAPRSAFQPQELAAINRFLDAKGKLVLLVDAVPNDSNVEDLVKRWEVTFGKGVVVDPLSAFPQDATVLIVGQYNEHSITRDFATRAAVFPTSTNIETPRFSQGINVQSLALSSGTRSWLETNLGQQAAYEEGVDKQGPLALAVSVEVVENPEVQEGLPPGMESTLKRVRNRAVIFGSSEFAANGPLNLGVNRDFFLNALNWVTETDQLISTRPRLEERRPLFLTQVQSNFVLFSGSVFLPMILLGLGGVIWWTRR